MAVTGGAGRRHCRRCPAPSRADSRNGSASRSDIVRLYERAVVDADRASSSRAVQAALDEVALDAAERVGRGRPATCVVLTVEPTIDPTLIPWRSIGAATGPTTSIARQALTSRPVTVLPTVGASGDAGREQPARSCGRPSASQLIALRARAATPVTWGAAIDVPATTRSTGEAARRSPAAGDRRQDVRARGREVHRRLAVVRERGEPAVLVDRRRRVRTLGSVEAPDRSADRRRRRCSRRRCRPRPRTARPIPRSQRPARCSARAAPRRVDDRHVERGGVVDRVDGHVVGAADRGRRR